MEYTNKDLYNLSISDDCSPDFSKAARSMPNLIKGSFESSLTTWLGRFIEAASEIVLFIQVSKILELSL